MSAVTGKAFDFSLLRRVTSYVKPYRKYFVLTAFLTIFSAFISPVRPWLIQYTIDKHVNQDDSHSLLMMTIIMIIVLMVEGLVQFYQTYYSSWLGQNVVKDLRVRIFKKVISFKLKYYDKNAIGTLVTRTVSDIETISDVFSDGILVIIGDILKLVVVLAIMLFTDWKLTLISLVSLPLLLFSTYIFKNAVKSAFQDVRTQVSRLNAFVQEHLTGMNIVQIFSREEKELQKFKEINAEHRDANIRSVWAYSVFFPIVEILNALSLAVLVWWGAFEAIEGHVTFGELVAFILYIHMMFRPIRQLADRFNSLQMGMVSSERVFKILDTEEMISDEGNNEASTIKGNISFKDVWFAYNDEDWILKNVSFQVKQGEKLALVGATGAGKSSVINLLGRFYEYNKGTIEVDGVNIREYKLAELRKNIGVVLQDVFLFSDTIYNNVTLKEDGFTKEQVKEAAQAIGAWDFIEKLPGQLDYNVRERGGMLSVGQRQLIAFIRAYLFNPRILVLDEATSSIDTESESMIQKATEKITHNRTSVIIAHRLATIQHVDRILVFEKGEILEQGSHSELLALNGAYKKLFELQFKQ